MVVCVLRGFVANHGLCSLLFLDNMAWHIVFSPSPPTYRSVIGLGGGAGLAMFAQFDAFERQGDCLLEARKKRGLFAASSLLGRGLDLNLNQTRGLVWVF